MLPLPLVFADRRLHRGVAFFHYHLSDDFVLAVVFLVCLQETVHKDSCRRFVPKIARRACQMKAEVISRATLPNLGIKVADVLTGDGILEPLVGRRKFLSKMVPDFSLMVD
jgi:hypothetical protein